MVRISRILRMFGIIGLNILKMLSIIQLSFLKMLKVPEMSMMICKGTDLEDSENVRIPKKNMGIQVLKSKVANSENADNERTLRLLKNIRITNIDILLKL